MTPEAFKRKMEEIAAGCEPESGHYLADELLCEVLRALGYGEGVEVFEEMTKWYA